jgi:uncharacterized protein with LGFP repeats
VKIKRAAFFPLSLALWAGCSDETEASVSSLHQAETIAAGSSEMAKLGQGWDKTAEVFKAQCVSSNVVHGGQTYGRILSNSTISQSSIEQDLGIDINVKGHYLFASAQDKAAISQAMKQDDYSESFIFVADYQTGIDSLDENTLKNTPVGDGAGSRWQQVCGDEAVYQVKTGAKFYFIERIDFVSREEKSRFDNDAQLAVSSGVAAVDLEFKLQQVANKYAKSARVHVEVFQFGGDPSNLGAVLNGVSGGSQSGAQAVVDCDMSHLDACKAIRANAVRYTDPNAPNGLAAQLKNPAISQSPISYLTKPWQNFNRNVVPRILTQEITTARSTLQMTFDALMKWKVRVDRLLYTVGNAGAIAIHSFALPPAQLNELQSWQTKLSNDLWLVNQAVIACYDGIDFDPSGKPLADRVTACQKAVDAVPRESPPAALLTAAGRYEIDARWGALGGVNSPVGDYAHFVICWVNPPTCQRLPDRLDAQAVGQDSIGLMQQFDKGQIYWSPDTDAHAVYGDILKEYLAIGGPGPNLLNFGFPLNDESQAKGDGRFNEFERGSIYYNPRVGAHEVHGAIRDHWTALGREYGWLGFPVTDERSTPDYHGRFNHFEGGSIYWTPGTGAWAVWGLIRDTWANQGWERSSYGYPISDEIWENSGDWRHSDFQNGSIYFNGTLASQGKTSIFEMKDAIAFKFRSLRNPNGSPGVTGYPVGPQLTAPDGVGIYQWYQNGAIYWHPKYGAHEIHGAIAQTWANYGYEKGRTLFWVSDSTLGYPTSDEIPLTNYRYEPGAVSFFEGGAIYWSGSGTHVVAGTFWFLYRDAGFEKGLCGFPASDVSHREPWGARSYYRQQFQNGYMKFYPDSGDTEVHCPSDGN